MYKDRIDIDSVVRYVATCDPDTRVYVGCDSERIRVDGIWYADYTTAVVVHINGNQGCKIFGAIQRERDYEHREDKPRMRLMNEVIKAANLYLELAAVIPNEIQVHLDINPNELYNSNIVINEAVGYIRGMCNVIPLVKPDAWAASYAPDRFKEILGHRRAVNE